MMTVSGVYLRTMHLCLFCTMPRGLNVVGHGHAAAVEENRHVYSQEPAVARSEVFHGSEKYLRNSTKESRSRVECAFQHKTKNFINILIDMRKVVWFLFSPFFHSTRVNLGSKIISFSNYCYFEIQHQTCLIEI